MATLHRLFIFKGGAPRTERERLNRALTIRAVRFVKENLGVFGKMGVKVRIIALSPSWLKEPRNVAGLRRALTEGMPSARKAQFKVRFPALLTPNGAYTDCDEIIRLYADNIRAFRAQQRQGLEAVGGHDEDDDPLSTYYADEMTMASAQDDVGVDEAAIGEEGDMMANYRRLMDRRSKPGPPKPGPRPPPAKPTGKATVRGGKAVARVATARADNIADNPLDALDALGADAADPAGSSADDHMMRTWLENLESS